ncbi:MAG: GumC family protein [Candidatus Hydrogenedentes bacterium]|nr:GumC family protein [Candidatus Hydrogenedentota bacterium]
MAQVDESSASAREQLELVRRVLRKRWWMLGVLAVVGGITAFGTAKMLSPVYEASTTVRILRQPVLGGDPSQARPAGTRNSLSAEASWLTSSMVLRPVIDRLALVDTPPSSALEAAIWRGEKALKRFFGGASRDDARPFELMDQLRNKAIKVKELQGFDALEIHVQWHDPEMTMRLANTIVDVFIERFTESSKGVSRQKKEYLEAQVQLVKLQLNDSEAKLANFQKKTGIVSTDGTQIGFPKGAGTQQLMVEKRQLELQYAAATAELQQLDARIENKDTGKKKPASDSLRAALKNPNSMLRMLLSQAVIAEAEVTKMKSTYTDEGLATSRAARDLESLKTRLAGELKQLGADPEMAMDDLFVMVQQEEQDAGVSESLLARYESDRLSLAARIKTYADQLSRLDAEIGQAEKESKSLPDELQQYMALTREKRVNEELYTRLCAQLSGAQVDENSKLYDVNVFEPAHLPTEATKPKPMLMAGVGTFLGLLLGICVAFSLEYLDDSLRTSQEVQYYLGLPVLAEIPKVKVHKKALFAKNLPKLASLPCDGKPAAHNKA